MFKKRSKFTYLSDLKLSTKIALRGFRPRRSPCWNLPLLDSMEDDLAKDPGPVGDLYSGNTSFAPFCNFIPNPDLVLALVRTLVPAPVLAPTPAPAITNDLFKQFIKAYLESNQGPRQPLAERKKPLKAKIPELYYGLLSLLLAVQKLF